MTHASPPTLTILGASARAAAQSALRAGFAPSAGDLFADADLQACCPSTRISNFPQDFPALLDQSPVGAWMYTGGLENYPRLIERMERRQLLYGNGCATLLRVRDPFAVTSTLDHHQFAVPAIRSSPDGLPQDGTWICKRRHSAGGLQVAAWYGERQTSGAAADGQSTDVYFQQRINGVACSAAYVATSGSAVLLGATQQLLRGPWNRDRDVPSHASRNADFQYVGSLGPLSLESSESSALVRMGHVLAAEFQLEGLFGLDYVLAKGVPWPVEVNPRYTASVEIFERAWGVPIVGWHVDACRDHVLPATVPDWPAQRWGKVTVYARRDLVFDHPRADRLRSVGSVGPYSLLADIPAAGSDIAAHLPVLTVFAAGESLASVRAGLLDRSAEIEAVLFG